MIGVVLTGHVDDGTAGLQAIKACGGVAVVQDPCDAAESSMPRSALKYVEVDHCVPLAAMPALFASLGPGLEPGAHAGPGASCRAGRGGCRGALDAARGDGASDASRGRRGITD